MFGTEFISLSLSLTLYIYIRDGKLRMDPGIDPSNLRRFGQSFALLPIQGHFGSSPVQIFRQSNLNSELNFWQIPVVISKLSTYGIYKYIYIYIVLKYGKVRHANHAWY